MHTSRKKGSSMVLMGNYLHNYKCYKHLSEYYLIYKYVSIHINNTYSYKYFILITCLYIYIRTIYIIIHMVLFSIYGAVCKHFPHFLQNIIYFSSHVINITLFLVQYSKFIKFSKINTDLIYFNIFKLEQFIFSWN